MPSIRFFGCIGYFEPQCQQGVEPISSLNLACEFDFCERLIAPSEE